MPEPETCLLKNQIWKCNKYTITILPKNNTNFRLFLFKIQNPIQQQTHKGTLILTFKHHFSLLDHYNQKLDMMYQYYTYKNRVENQIFYFLLFFYLVKNSTVNGMGISKNMQYVIWICSFTKQKCQNSIFFFGRYLP